MSLKGKVVDNLKKQLAACCDAQSRIRDSTLVTVVITTSPVKSNPDTDMMEEVVRSFSIVPLLRLCRLIIVCDGFLVGQEGAKWKPGRVSPSEAKAYEEYKDNLSIRVKVRLVK
jgi:hypothetical protein